MTKEYSEGPQHIVLVDIKKAANETIACVEKPMNQERYVALSYRSGEVQETAVDTQLGYTAYVTSFDMSDFYKLCKMMLQEQDLHDIPYVWVDALCVNPDQRKAMLHQTHAIYKQASYIVAVPDLHLAYLTSINKSNGDITANAKERNEEGQYIYHLLHGNKDVLDRLDQKWLDTIGAPKDSKLRYLLTRYTDYFTQGFMTCKHHHWGYDAKHTLAHIYATNPKSRIAPQRNMHMRDAIFKVISNLSGTAAKLDKIEAQAGAIPTTAYLDRLELKQLHMCEKDPADCALTLFGNDNGDQGEQQGNHVWRQAIPERGETIRQCMRFLIDLVVDWSSRVWTINECHAAREKHLIKYWFLQLGEFPEKDFHYQFYQFDFNNNKIFCDDFYEEEAHFQKSNAVYQLFHVTMQQQLQQQHFLERVLKSKTSRHEDRLYATLPISQYKDKLKSVMENPPSTLVTVKLQLFEWMDIKHKWLLLLLASRASNMGLILPTFATSNITWPHPKDFPTLEVDPDTSSFDLANDSAITLNDKVLTVKPRFYFRNAFSPDHFTSKIEIDPLVRTLAQFDIRDKLDFIWFPLECDTVPSLRPKDPSSNRHIFLVGCSATNEWILCPHLFRYSDPDTFRSWKFYDDNISFDVY